MAATDLQPGSKARWRGSACWVLLLAATVLFLYRSTARPGTKLYDFGIIYSTSRAWLLGDNPYDPAVLQTLWHPRGGIPQLSTGTNWLLPVFTPLTLVVMAPWAILPAGLASWVWLWSSLAAVGLLIQQTLQRSRLRWRTPAGLAMMAAILLLGPLQSAVEAGQPVVWCVALGLWALGGDSEDLPLGRATVAALSVAFKPQVGILFFVGLLILKRWRTASLAMTIVVGLAVLAVTRMAAAGIPWMTDWLNILRLAMQPGGMDDFLPPNPSRDHLLNLQLMFGALTGNWLAAMRLAWLVWLLLTGGVLLALRRRRFNPALALALCAVLGLMPVYHRYYDGTILVLLFCWITGALRQKHSRPAWIAAALCIPLLLPVGWQTNLLAKGYVSMALANSAVWKMVIVPFNAWLLLAIALMLLYAAADSRNNTCP